MTKTLTDNDLVSTSEIARQLRLKGIKNPFGYPQLSTEILLKKGFHPVVKIREGSYWSRDVLNQIITAVENAEKSTTKDDESFYTHKEVVKAICENFEALGSDVVHIKEMLDLIWKELHLISQNNVKK